VTVRAALEMIGCSSSFPVEEENGRRHCHPHCAALADDSNLRLLFLDVPTANMDDARRNRLRSRSPGGRAEPALRY
jgi:hypothetical protein